MPSSDHAPAEAISEPEHALVSCQILAAWGRPLDERVVLAAGQHDVAWPEIAPMSIPKRGGRASFAASAPPNTR